MTAEDPLARFKALLEDALRAEYHRGWSSDGLGDLRDLAQQCDDARAALLAEAERLVATRVAAVCPCCRGTGLRSIPPGVAGDQPTFATNESGPWPCRPCGGTGVLWGPGATEGRSE